MQNPFSIPKQHIIRHKILSVLYDSENPLNNPIVGSIKIANVTKIAIGEIHTWHQSLLTEGEIVAIEENGQLHLSITENGKTSFIEKKYLRKGRKEIRESIYDWVKIVAPLLALALSAYTIYSNSELKKKIKELELQIHKKP